MVSDWKNETMATDANLWGYAIQASFGVPRHSLSILVFFKVWMIKNRVVQLLSCVNLRHWTSKLDFWIVNLVPTFIFQAHFVSQASFQETFGELLIDLDPAATDFYKRGFLFFAAASTAFPPPPSFRHRRRFDGLSRFMAVVKAAT